MANFTENVKEAFLIDCEPLLTSLNLQAAVELNEPEMPTIVSIFAL